MTVRIVPEPYPAAVRPTARPRLSGNHLIALLMQVAYTAPTPRPPTTAPA